MLIRIFAHLSSWCRYQILELPGNVPYKVTTDLILASFEHLAHLAERCSQETKSLLSEVVNHNALAVFGQFELGGLRLAVE